MTSGDQKPQLHWYVARTQPHKERYALAVLEQHGVESYLPMLSKQKPRPGRRAWEPLFGGYVFARLQMLSDQWLTVRSAPTLAYFLGQAGQPTPLPEDFVPSVRTQLDGLNRTGGLASFRHGQRVTIIETSFRHYDAMFDRRLSPSGRSRVLVSVLNRLIPIDLPEEYLRAAG